MTTPSRYVPPTRVARELLDRQRVLLALIAAEPEGVPRRVLRLQLMDDVKDLQLKADLALLRDLGLIESKGLGRGARWFLRGARADV